MIKGIIKNTFVCKGHLNVQFYTEKQTIKGISNIRKCIIRLSGI